MLSFQNSVASPVQSARRTVHAARPSPTFPGQQARRARVLTSGYKFGDLSRRLAQEAQEGLTKLGQSVAGDEYKFGDLTKRTLGAIKEQADKMQLKKLSYEALDKLRGYRFGDLTKAALKTTWGQELLDSAEAAGRKVTGRPDYKVGDLSKQVLAGAKDAKDRAARLLALPSEVEQLKQVVVEQQILLNALTKSEGTKEEAATLMRLSGSAEELKPLILDQQDLIDVLLSSEEDGGAK